MVDEKKSLTDKIAGTGIGSLFFKTDSEEASKQTTPAIPPSPFRSSSPTPLTPQVITPAATVDPQVEAMLKGVVDAVPNRQSYVAFSNILKSLEGIVTIEDQRYKAALKAAGTSGHTKEQVLQSVSAILDALATTARDIHTTAPQKLAEKVSARQNELRQVENMLADKKSQIERLQQEVVQLTAEQTKKAEAVNEERRVSEEKVARFDATYKFMESQFISERDKIANYSQGVN